MSITLVIDGTGYPYPSDASDTNWAAQQVAAMQALAAGVTESLTAESFTAITLVNGWSNSGGVVAGSSLSPQGRVWLRGQIEGGVADTTCGTLPVGRRPAYDMSFLGVMNSNGLCKVRVSTLGVILVSVLMAGSGDPTDGVDLSGISFSTVA